MIEMDCSECARLTGEYERLRRVWSAAIDALTTGVHTGASSEYESLRRALEEASREAEIARLELVSHQRTHQPGVSTAGA